MKRTCSQKNTTCPDSSENTDGSQVNRGEFHPAGILLEERHFDTKDIQQVKSLVRMKKDSISFHKQLQNELKEFILSQNNKYPNNELLKVDLHCHDYNSNVPDEILGRILGVSETWLKSEKLLEVLKKNGCNAFTVTNHNNSRSCHELIHKGYDILIGAEFSVTVPDYNIGIHILTYGFSIEEEKWLNKLRYNVYEFLKFAHKHKIPTIWAHPLYHYAAKEQPPFVFFSKMALLFERFEVINGQRDTWQNMLVKNWISSLTPEMIDRDAKRFAIDLKLYSNRPYQKTMTGGSDDHMGIFAGHSGSYLHVPNLNERLKTSSRSELALEAIREHRIVPFGNHQNIEKLTVAFLDYVFQVAMNIEKPDLLRMILHKGTVQDKIIAVLISNLFFELKHHKTTMLFIKLFHKCFVGKRPKKMTQLLVKKVYKPVFKESINIVNAHDFEPDEMTEQFYQAITNISNQLSTIFFERLQKKIDALTEKQSFAELNLDSFIEQIKLSPNVRDYIGNNSNNDKHHKKKITDFLDGLSFPLLSSTLILAANYTSSKVLYYSRKTLTDFSEELGILKHPERMLWLTDTFNDKNGVSIVLQEMHREIKRLDLPIDILVCSNTVKPDDHLIVMKPQAEFTLPFYKDQTVRIPNINQLHALFLENEYDRLICSTEGVMGMISVFLKNAYTVPAFFYIHTDWIMFVKKALKLDIHDTDKVRRLLRMFYSNFDKLFVLNSEHKEWLSSHNMNFDKENIFQTAHWVDSIFKPVLTNKKKVFKLKENTKILLYSGRLSEEKGVFDIVKVFKRIITECDSVKMVFLGNGPAEEKLKSELPDAIFLGWVDRDRLPAIYSAADMLILPSKFDTFGLVVLEALSCGLPVASYNSKGPKDIIVHESCGYIASGVKEMARHIIDYISDEDKQKIMKHNAIVRARNYSKKDIMQKFIECLGLS